MSVISLTTIGERMRDAVMRFPLAVVLIVLSAVLLQVQPELFFRYFIFGALAASFWSVSVTLASEFSGYAALTNGKAMLLGVLGGAGLWLLIYTSSSWISVSTLILGLFLLSFISPFLLSREASAKHIAAFCDAYKNALLLSVVVGILLALGGGAIIGSMIFLLGGGEGVQEACFRFLLLLLCIIVPLFLLGSLPVPAALKEKETPYLRTILGYFLVPMMVIYAVILHLYLFKIALAWELPKGGVAWLVLCFAATGIFSYTVIVSLEFSDKIFAFFKRSFPWALVLPFFFLAWGGLERISTYGFTESRYYLLAVWLWIFISLMLILLRRRASTLVLTFFGFPAIVLILSSFGPWSAYNVAVRSQVARLEALLENEGLLRDGKLYPLEAGQSISAEARKELTELSRYFARYDRKGSLRHYNHAFEALSLGASDASLVKALDIERHPDVSSKKKGNTFRYRKDREAEIVSVEGYDYFYRPQNTILWKLADELETPEGVLRIQYDKERKGLSLKPEAKEEAETFIPLEELFSKAADAQASEGAALYKTVGRYKVYLRMLAGTRAEDGELFITQIQYDLLIKKR